MSIDELLTRAVAQVIPNKSGLKKLMQQKKIRVYLGIDPTNNKLHLGHTVQLRKLQQFADLGHEAILLFGTGTVLVGDPSERAEGRKLITQKEIDQNIKTWKKQVEPIINFNQVKIKQNGDWLTKLTLKDIIKIASNISAVQLFKRESFQRRLKQGDTVWYHETMYPLLQGYDSVVMDVDLEIGGTDQTFNMLIGRELQQKMNRREKFVLAGKMIVGTDGKPMSKTSGNCIWLTDSANDMFGKLMKVQDELIADYFEFFTTKPMTKISQLKKKLQSGQIHPMTAKKDLALTITAQFHGNQQAQAAQAHFERVYQDRGVPKKINQVSINQLSHNPINIINLINQTELASSRSAAKRLIQQGGVKLNQQKISHLDANIKLKPNDILQIGRRKFIQFK
jgi:tyrosyl-tRNA synthetase